MDNLNSVPYFEDTLVVSWDTIHKTTEDVNTQSRFQKKSKNPVFYEVLYFHNKPIQFHSFVILLNNDNLSLNSDYGKLNFVCETLLKCDPENLKIFVRLVYENKPPKYKKLTLFNKNNDILVFLDKEALNTVKVEYVDRILLVGCFESLSYLVLSFKANKKKFNKFSSFKNNVYYGKNILDLNKHIIASESLDESVSEEQQDPDTEYLKLLKETKNTTYRTLNDLNNYLIINEQYEKIQNLKKNLNYLVEDINSQKHLEESVVLMSRFICNDLLFKDFLDYNVLETLTNLLYNNIVYEHENNNFKLLKLLLHDSRIAKYFLDKLAASKCLGLLVSDTSSMDEKSCSINLLLILLSHPFSISRFVSSDSREKAFNYDRFVRYTHTSTTLSNIFNKWLADIGLNVSLYIALSDTESFYNSVKGLKSEKGNITSEFTQKLTKLSKSVNFSLERLKKLEASADDFPSNRNKFIVQFAVSCLRDTQFPKVVSFLFDSVYRQLSCYPLLSVDVWSLVYRPFKFISKYMEYFQFQDSLVTLYKITQLVLKMKEPTEKNIRNGFPYSKEAVYGHFDKLNKDCFDLLLYSRVFLLVSSTISQGSFDTTIDHLYSLSKDYEGFYKAFTRFLEKVPVSTFILKSLNSYVNLIRDDSPPALMNKINKNVSLLLNLICKSLHKDQTYKVLQNFGKGLLEFMDFYLAKFGRSSKSLDFELAESTLSILRNLYSFFVVSSERDKKELVDDVEEFLSSVLRAAGLDFEKMLGTESEDVDQDSRYSSFKLRYPNEKEKNKKNLYEKQSQKEQTKNYKERKEPKSKRQKVSSTYCNNLNFTYVEVKMPKKFVHKRARELGVEDEMYQHYEDLGLAVVPKEFLPLEVDFALSLLVGLAQVGENGHLFRAFLESETENSNIQLDQKNKTQSPTSLTTVMNRAKARKRNSGLDLWLYSCSCVSSDFDTQLNAELDSFSSLVGYCWLENEEFFVPLMVKTMYLFYLSLRHLSYDSIDVSFKETLGSYNSSDSDTYKQSDAENGEVDLYYFNQELLNCMVLSSVYLFTSYGKHRSEDSECGYPNMLYKLMNYWFKRFKRSRGRLLNCLMETCTVLPRFYEGAAFLIVCCNPFSDIKTVVRYKGVDTENSSREDKDKEDNKKENNKNKENNKKEKENKEKQRDEENIEDQVTFRINDSNYRLEKEEEEKFTIEYFTKLFDNYTKVDKKLLVEFMCVVASRSYSVDPSVLVSTACLSSYLNLNLLPIYEFVNLVLNLESEEVDVNTKLRLFVFYSNAVNFTSFGNSKQIKAVLAVTIKCLKTANSLFDDPELPEYSYPVLLEGVNNCICCFNKMWAREKENVSRLKNFTTYVVNAVSSVFWVFKMLNGSKLEFVDRKNSEGSSEENSESTTENSNSQLDQKNKTQKDNGENTGKNLKGKLREKVSEHVSSDVVVMGLDTVCNAFYTQLVSLSTLYSLTETEEFPKKMKDYVSVYLEKADSRVLDKHPTSEGKEKYKVKTQVSEFVAVNNLLDYLRECCYELEILSDTDLFNLVYSFYLLVKLFRLILNTGRDQYLFVLHMVLNKPFSELVNENKFDDLFDTLFHSLDSLLNYCKTKGDKKHLVALVVMVRTNLEELKQELTNDSGKLLPLQTSVSVSSLLNQSVLPNNLFFYSYFRSSLAKKLFLTTRSYKSWRKWSRMACLFTLEVDYNESNRLLPYCSRGYKYSGEHEPYESLEENETKEKTEKEKENKEKKKKTQEDKDNKEKETVDFSSDKDTKDYEVLQPVPSYKNPDPDFEQKTLPTNVWNRFDVELTTSGLDLISLISNPSLLRETKTRKTFLNAIYNDKELFNHVVKLGLNILE